MQIMATNLKFNGLLTKRKSTKRAIIHHSASPDVPASTIHSWHLGQKWAGIGYHFVIRANGAIERGRSEWAIGAHSGPQGNGDSVGVVLTGNFETGKPTEAQIASLVWLIKSYLTPKYGDLKVIGHKDVMATACPGRNFPWGELKKRLEGEPVEDWMKKLGEESIDYLVAQGLIKDPAYWKARVADGNIPYWLFWLMLRRVDERRGR